MPRKKPEPNVYERYADSVRPYLAERVLFGEYDVLESVVVPAVDADGSLVAAGYELEPVTDPRIVRWVDTFREFDNRNEAPLIALLGSDFELLPILHRRLTDLLWRHRLTKKKVVSRATPYERRVLALRNALEALRKRKRLYGRQASDILRELDDLMSRRKLPARMISRYDFVRREGAQFTPAYTMTGDDAQLHARFHVADEDVQAYMATHGVGIGAAVDKIASERFPPVDDEKSDRPKARTERLTAERAEFAAALEAYHKKSHASSRRKEKRRKY